MGWSTGKWSNTFNLPSSHHPHAGHPEELEVSGSRLQYQKLSGTGEPLVVRKNGGSKMSFFFFNSQKTPLRNSKFVEHFEWNLWQRYFKDVVKNTKMIEFFSGGIWWIMDPMDDPRFTKSPRLVLDPWMPNFSELVMEWWLRDFRLSCWGRLFSGTILVLWRAWCPNHKKPPTLFDSGRWSFSPLPDLKRVSELLPQKTLKQYSPKKHCLLFLLSHFLSSNLQVQSAVGYPCSWKVWISSAPWSQSAAAAAAWRLPGRHGPRKRRSCQGRCAPWWARRPRWVDGIPKKPGSLRARKWKQVACRLVWEGEMVVDDRCGFFDLA